MGYDTLLGDGGSTLSGGQRQRLALARAAARRPAILLLDEATSDLDNVTERIVADNLARLRCTRIVIAHRLSTVIDADRIVVLEGGAVVETGSRTRRFWPETASTPSSCEHKRTVVDHGLPAG